MLGHTVGISLSWRTKDCLYIQVPLVSDAVDVLEPRQHMFELRRLLDYLQTTHAEAVQRALVRY
jgi:hypothetical protein